MRKPVQMVYARKTMGDFWRHELRWAIGLRNVRPAGYMGLLFTFGLPWALVAAVAAPSAGIASAYLAGYLVLRLGLVWTMGVWGLDDAVTRRNWWLVPWRDAVNFAVWVMGFFASKIAWRGKEYRVRNGSLLPVEQTSRVPVSAEPAGD